jgi:hypothetical protein
VHGGSLTKGGIEIEIYLPDEKKAEWIFAF